MTRTAMIFSVLVSALLVTPARAEFEAFDGVELITLEIDGAEYVTPVGNRERKESIYYLKKGLRGDREAMEMFLMGQSERVFFVGMENPLWIKVNMDGAEIIN